MEGVLASHPAAPGFDSQRSRKIYYLDAAEIHRQRTA